jgi:DNA topoisomerase-2
MTKPIEQKYKKLSDIDHVLLRPGMWVGSTKPCQEEMYLPDEAGLFQKRQITYNPALLKIFDEIVSNSVDEHRRNKSLNELKVKVDPDSFRITVWDNGGIPVEMHSEYKEWIPEMIFSSLKAGSNFDDSEERLVAGTNGVGSTLTNIFSTWFRVRTADGKKAFEQVFTENMRSRSPAKIIDWKKGFTEIAFDPDLQRFGLSSIDQDHLDLMRKRCINLAACNPDLTVWFNDTKYRFKSFKEYCALYGEGMVYEESGRWKIAITASGGSFEQVSFVNSVETKDGGTHVDHAIAPVLEWIRTLLKRKHKVDLKPSELRNHLFAFVQCDVVNPSFSSQTKEKLITEARDFGSKCEPSDKFMKAVVASEVIQRVLDWAQQKALADERKQLRELNKDISKGKVLKLIDAKSRVDRESCTLSLFEGDCLDSNTEIVVFRQDIGVTKAKLSDVMVGDHVITHSNRLREVVAKSSKISKIFEIKSSAGPIRASGAHRMWAYDTKDNQFKFVRVDEIEVGRHRLVKNKLSSACLFLKIESTLQVEGKVVISCDGDVILSTPTHKFAVFDIEDQQFKMIQALDLSSENHYLVLNQK